MSIKEETGLNGPEIKIGNSCGSCIHTSRPKKPKEPHAAHYEVAKTERWCFKHNCHVTRETTCDDHEGVNRAAKTGYSRIKTFNERLYEVREVIRLMGDKRISVDDRVYYVENNRIYYYYPKYGVNAESSIYWSLSSKSSSTDRYIASLLKILTNTDPI